MSDRFHWPRRSNPGGGDRVYRPGKARVKRTSAVTQGVNPLAETAREAVSSRLVRGVALLLLGLTLALGIAVADAYLHRGIETSAAPPYVQQVIGRQMAINVDLRPFGADQLPQVAKTLTDMGVRTVRQPFDWVDIEPEKGVYTWERYDAIVRAMTDAGIQLVPVLAKSPGWARSPDAVAYTDAPPTTPDRYALIAGALAERYGASLGAIQVWNQPNIPEYWGGVSATPAEYLELLAPSFNAVRSVNPDIQVVTAELAPALPGGDPGADLAFVRGLYQIEAQSFFDAIAVRIDGGTSTPYDRSVDADRSSFSRALLFREVMVEAGDPTKGVWLTHFGWDADKVTAENQGLYTVGAIERARREWPWLGQMFIWGLLPDPTDPATSNFALLNSAGQPTEAYDLVSGAGAAGLGSWATTGYVPMGSAPLAYTGTWSDQHLNGQVFRTTGEVGSAAQVTFEGSGITAFLRESPEAGPVFATLDGQPLPGFPVENGKAVIDLTWYQAEDIPVLLASNLDGGIHVLNLELGGTGQLTIGGLVVSQTQPVLWPIAILLAAAIALAAFGLRDLLWVAAIRSRLMGGRSGSSSDPPLPSLPNWRPTLRA